MAQKVDAALVEKAITPLLFALEDAPRQIRSQQCRNETKCERPCWKWYLSLKSIEAKRAATSIIQGEAVRGIHELVRKQREYERKHSRRRGLSLLFSRIKGDKDRALLASLGDFSMFASRDYFPMQSKRLMSEGIGIDSFSIFERGLASGKELAESLCAISLDRNVLCLSLELLENETRLGQLMNLASFGNFFGSEQSCVEDEFSLGEFIVNQIQISLVASMTSKSSIPACIHDVSVVETWWMTSLPESTRAKILLGAVRDRLKRSTKKDLDALRRLSKEMICLELPSIFVPLLMSSGTPAVNPTLGDMISESIVTAWRTIIETELTATEASVSSSGRSKKKKKSSSKQQASMSESSGGVTEPIRGKSISVEDCVPSEVDNSLTPPTPSVELTPVPLNDDNGCLRIQTADGGLGDKSQPESKSEDEGEYQPAYRGRRGRRKINKSFRSEGEESDQDVVLHRDTALALELSRVTAELARLSQQMDVLKRTVLDDVSLLRTQVSDMGQTLKSLTQQVSLLNGTSASSIGESPSQNAIGRKSLVGGPSSPHITPGGSTSLPSSPHLANYQMHHQQFQQTIPGFLGQAMGSGSVPASPRNVGLGSLASNGGFAVKAPLATKSSPNHSAPIGKSHGTHHLRRASVSEASLPQQQQARMRGNAGTAWSSVPPAQYQHHHPSAGVLHSAQIRQTPQSSNSRNTGQGTQANHNRPWPAFQSKPVHSGGPRLPGSDALGQKGDVPSPVSLNAPSELNSWEAGPTRPHEWHGSDTDFFPPLSSTVRGRDSAKSVSASCSSQQVTSSSGSTFVPSGQIVPETFVLPAMSKTDLLPTDLESASVLSHGAGAFVEHCRTQRMLKSSSEQAALEAIKAVVQSVWPRARVKGYGSTVTGLSLPLSDMDVVVVLPKVTVMRDAIAEEVGPLEGHSADERTSWQQKLAAALLQAPWVDSDSLRTIQHAPMPVITLTTRGPPFFEVPISLDVTFQSETHHGLATNKLVNALQREYRMLRPLVLIVKQFLADRGLGKGFSGGLSSYALVIMCTCFLYSVNKQLGLPADSLSANGSLSPALSMKDDMIKDVIEKGDTLDIEEASEEGLGTLLICFLRFFGEHYDARTTGISMTRGFFPRNTVQSHPHHAIALQAQQTSQQQQRRRSFRIEDLQPQAGGFVHHHGTQVQGPTHSGSHDVIPPHKFDPLLIEDPLQPNNNVGRNVFRIHQIQRACLEAAQNLRSYATMDWPLSLVISSWNPSPGAVLTVHNPQLTQDDTDVMAGWAVGRKSKMVARSNSIV